MTTIRIEGAATLLASLHHGGDHAGTVSYLRREKIMQPDGSVAEVPVVSGNAFRGILRDHAARLFWALLGEPPLPAPVFHLLWSGGALAKAGSGHVLGARQLQEVRALVPVVSVFGGSGAGKIIEGKLQVGKMVPICAETAHIIPPSLRDGATRSIWEVLQIEEFTRRDDTKRDLLHPAIAELAAPAPDTATLSLVGEHAPAVEDTDGPAQQMRYGVETIAAGTRLHWWMRIQHATPVERALLAGALESWLASGAHIGGRSATGHGRLLLDVAAWTQETAATVGSALATDGHSELVDHVDGHRDAILDALKLFA